MERPKVAAIVVAYNEAATIEGVVRPMIASALFHEVIVISDGSTDDTAERARRAGATLVHELSVNGGKGAAALHGVTHTDAPVICFADADLYGLRSEHLRAIVEPVLDGRKAMNVGLRDRSFLSMKLTAHLPLISGERAMRRQIIESIPQKFLQGFMLEAAVNYRCRTQGLPYGIVPCYGLKIRHKMQKVGFWRGLVGYLKMVYDVVRAMVAVRLAHLRGEF